MIIQIAPNCQRAANRVREHGDIFKLLHGFANPIRPEEFQVESMDGRWSGWFGPDEARIL